MTQLIHVMIAVILFNITFHLVLKKNPFMQEKIQSMVPTFLKYMGF